MKTIMFLHHFVATAFAIAISATSLASALPTRQDVGPAAMPTAIAPVSAPFAMPQPQRPVFPSRRVNVPEALLEASATTAIQQAIDSLSATGGGTVIIARGVWPVGRITLKSNVNLCLAKGCELHFSGRIVDYLPAVFTRDEGIEMYSLGACIYACCAENIAVTGEGKIVGPAADCEIFGRNTQYCLNIEGVVGTKPLADRHYDGIATHEVFLPKTIAPIHCKNVLIEGVTIERSLYWNIVPQYCDNVIIRGVTVSSVGHGRTDGIDIDSSSGVLIEYCVIDCQDDCIVMKAGRGWDGLRVSRPTENVVIRHCLALRGSGGLACGTEVAGGVRNVYMADCIFDGTDHAFRFKTLRTRGGGVSGVYVERTVVSVRHIALSVDMLGSRKWGGDLAARYPARQLNQYTPNFSNIFISNVRIDRCDRLLAIQGLPERPVSNVILSNAEARCSIIGKLCDVSAFSMSDVRLTTADSLLTIDGCDRASFHRVINQASGRPISVVKTNTQGRDTNQHGGPGK